MIHSCRHSHQHDAQEECDEAAGLSYSFLSAISLHKCRSPSVAVKVTSREATNTHFFCESDFPSEGQVTNPWHMHAIFLLQFFMHILYIRTYFVLKENMRFEDLQEEATNEQSFGSHARSETSWLVQLVDEM